MVAHISLAIQCMWVDPRVVSVLVVTTEKVDYPSIELFVYHF